ncbi:hypothetical protein F52700_13525 [Fusarium sp. NRRL 52700]|nr:hypothetical protein F52700_13525 [Fusarium sp. NRRL 52700]
MSPQRKSPGPGTSSYGEGLFEGNLSGDGHPRGFQSNSRPPHQRMILQLPMTNINGQQWHSRTRPEPTYLASRPRRLPNQYGAVGDGLPLPQKSAPASGSARRDPESDRTHDKLKDSPHLANLLPSDGELMATTLAELVASSIADEEPVSEISALAKTPSTSCKDPDPDPDLDPDSKEPTKLGQETKLLYIRDWKSALPYKHDPPHRP